ncbi:alpha-L-fucosidase [Fulvivirgaceae bacterium PWU4]|uniref:alpha-L-fucosidase n=1 Tax=Chryseosolibacter histidini TaxID=2782349 RepID=A0AAP2GKU2_9BACT|nr:alpha-L-fucosidase [Chryseosolibacter histidini]MBT1699399.1 alpha-L-fucosidase [Chryseosolibacter histidini]
MKNIKWTTFLGLMALPLILSAQSGDEAEMANKAKARDQAAINEAVNGWWKESMKNHEQRIAWWRDAKFGMFVHWGIYSLPGGEWKGNKVSGYAEHLMRKEKISRADYLALASQFNPVKFNADEWILAAKNAGMRYFIITSKHHDGFAMFDSKVSDFNIMRQTPFGRDPMAELAAACRKHGVKFGFYYSHAFDWEHPDAPGNDWEYNNPGGDKNLFGGPDGGRNWFDWHPELLPKAVKYVDEKAIPQIKELLQKYKPDILWFDTPSKLPLSENIRILKAIREVDNKVVVNGRLARSSDISFGDYKNTADRPAEFYPVEGDWEAIPTTNESYGYHKYDQSHKTPAHFIQLMASAASRGGNLLMNIGPMGDGRIDPKDLDILNAIGKWVKVNEESIYGTSVTPLPLQSWGASTLGKNKLYLHVYQWPANQQLVVGGLKSKIKKAYLLSDPSKRALKWSKPNTLDLSITVPEKAPDEANTVIVLETDGNVETDPVRLLTGGKLTQRLLAFDAAQQGKGFRYGDGKADRYYVEGWNKKDQSLSWKFRVEQPMSFNAGLKYIAVATGGGRVQVRLNGKVLFDQVVIADKQNGPAFKALGPLALQPGTYTLEIAATEIEGEEIMKLLEITLVP